jgi:hypothetical protein
MYRSATQIFLVTLAEGMKCVSFPNILLNDIPLCFAESCQQIRAPSNATGLTVKQCLLTTSKMFLNKNTAYYKLHTEIQINVKI